MVLRQQRRRIRRDAGGPAAERRRERLYDLVEAVLEPPVRRAFRWTVSGAERIPAEGPVLLAANHVSWLDPLCLGWVALGRGRRIRFLAMAELFRVPLFGTGLRRMGHIPVRRRTAGAGASLEPALAALARGECVAIFPEGGISRDLDPGPGRTGVARLAGVSGAPVVPVALWGAHRLVTAGRWPRWRRGVAQVVCVGPPLAVDPDEDRWSATDRVMAAVCAEVARARTLYPQRPRRDEDAWWMRPPETARLRSCRNGPGHQGGTPGPPGAPAP